MQLTKQIKNNIYLVIITMIILLSIFLLFQNVATNNNVVGQISTQQSVVNQQPATVTEPAQPIQNNEALPPQVIEATEAEQATVSDSDVTEPQAADNRKPPIFVIAIVAVVVVGVAAYYFIKKRREESEEIEDLETVEPIGEGRPSFVSKLFQRFRGDSSQEQDEQADDEEENGIIYEEGRGYRVNMACIKPIQQDGQEQSETIEPEEIDEPQDDGEDFDLDYSEYGQADPDVPEQEDSAKSDMTDELELCREIERLEDKANRHKEYIKIMADDLDLQIPPALIEDEDADELLGGSAGLQQEVERIKKKINAQIDYIENARKNQADNANKSDNNGNDQVFIDCVAAALNNMQQNDCVFKPQKQLKNQNITYVATAEFFTALSKTLPNYKRTSAADALKQNGIIDGDTVYNGKRVLKVNSEKFVLLTKGFAQDAGA